MTILPYQQIHNLCTNSKLIYPYVEKTQSLGLSYGFSESGYDIRLAQEIILYPTTFKNLFLNMIGFKHHSFALGSSMEYFNIPDTLMAFVLDKSTNARRGIMVQNTCAEPGWSGFLTLEITYHGTKKIILPKETPIAQIVFHELKEKTLLSYNGKYQNQEYGPQEAKFKF